MTKTLITDSGETTDQSDYKQYTMIIGDKSNNKQRYINSRGSHEVTIASMETSAIPRWQVDQMNHLLSAFRFLPPSLVSLKNLSSPNSS